MKKIYIPVQGTCTACERMIKMSVEDIQGVTSCIIEGASDTTWSGNSIIMFNETETSEEEIKTAIPRHYIR